MSTVAAQLGFVHCFVPAQESNATTLLLLHGTGGDETDLSATSKLWQLRYGCRV